jgi:sterol 3beta-glucosyltransferase
MLPPAKLSGWVNRLSYRMLQGYLWRALGRSAAAAHREVFGVHSNGKPKFDFPILYGISPHLLRQPLDWPPGHCLCGHWHLSVPDWRPPEDLMEFLSAGPPSYIGFGSSSGM